MFGVRTPWTLSSDLAWNKTPPAGRAAVRAARPGDHRRRPWSAATAFFVVLLGGIGVVSRRRVRLLLSGSGSRTPTGSRVGVTDVTGIDARLVVLIVPLVLLELGLTIWALCDLTRPGRRVRGESRLMWGAIVLFVSGLGPILYFVVGSARTRRASPSHDRPGRRPNPRDRPRRPRSRRRGAADVGRAARGSGPAPAWARRRPQRPRRARPRSPAVASRNAIRAASSRSTGSISTFPPARSSASSDRTARARRPRCDCSSGSPIRPAARPPSPASRSERPRLTDRIGFLDQDPRYYGWSTGRELRRARRTAPWARRAGACDTCRRGPRPGRAGRCRRPPDRDVLRRDAPAPRDRPGARRPTAGHDPRRAGQLPRPGGSARPAGPHRRAAEHGHRPVLDPCPRRRRAGVRPRRDPRPGPARDRGPAGRDLLDRYALPIYRVDPEPRPGRGGGAARRHAPGDGLGRPTSASSTAAIRIVVDDPARAARRAPARDRGGRAGRGRRRARPADPRGRVPPADREPRRPGPSHERGGGDPPQGARRGVADPPAARGRRPVRRSSGSCRR